MAAIAMAAMAVAACSPAPEAVSPTAEAPMAGAPAATAREPLTASATYEQRIASARASSSATTRAVAEVLEAEGSAEEKARFATGIEYELPPALQARVTQSLDANGTREKLTCHVPKCRVRLCGPKFEPGVDCGDVYCPDPICIDHEPQPQVPCKAGHPC
jgi:hypothetical protein